MYFCTLYFRECFNTQNRSPVTALHTNRHVCWRVNVQLMESLQQLRVTEDGRSLRVQTDLPHLVSLGTGRLSTTVTLLPLPPGSSFHQSPQSSSSSHDLFFYVRDQSSSVGLCTQDDKSLRVAVMICAILVNIRTHRQLCIRPLYRTCK